MTATLEQIQSDLLRLVNLVQQGEEVVITSQGRAVAKLSGLPPSAPSPNRQVWLARLRQLRESSATGRTSPTTEVVFGGPPLRARLNELLGHFRLGEALGSTRAGCLRQRVAVGGCMNSVGAIGAMLSPLVAAKVAVLWNWKAVFVVFAASYFLGALARCCVPLFTPDEFA